MSTPQTEMHPYYFHLIFPNYSITNHTKRLMSVLVTHHRPTMDPTFVCNVGEEVSRLSVKCIPSE